MQTQTYIRIAYSVVTNTHFAFAHQMWHSKVLPWYSYSSAGAYEEWANKFRRLKLAFQENFASNKRNTQW